MLTGATASFKVSVDKETLKRAKGKFKIRAGYWYEQAWLLLEDADRDRLRPKFKAPAGGPDRKGDAEGWSHFSINSACDPSGAFVRSGRYSLHCPPNAKGEMNLFLVSKVRLIARKKYNMSCWALTDGGGRGTVEVQGANDADGNLYTVSMAILPDKPFWHRVKVDFEPPKGVSEVNFRLVLAGKNAHVWLDDISLLCERKELVTNGSFETPR